MLQIRLHGRGGQGVVTAAEMLSLAAFLEGPFAQAFPSFGSERTGAPVVAYARIGEEEIRTHEPIQNPDVLSRIKLCLVLSMCSVVSIHRVMQLSTQRILQKRYVLS